MNIWKLIYRISLVIIGVVVLLGVGYAYWKPMKEHQALNARKEQIEQATHKQQEKLDDLKQKQERLQTDPRFVEKMAREDLGLAKPGETIFKFEGDSSNAVRK